MYGALPISKATEFYTSDDANNNTTAGNITRMPNRVKATDIHFQ
jgi:hypothetical protein